MRRQRRTKILATVGPASRSPNMLAALFEAGVDVFRLNFSHGVHDDHAAAYDAIRELETRVDRPIGVLADLQGPKHRVGAFKDGPVKLDKGDEIRVDLDPEPGDRTRVSLPHPEIFSALEPGALVLVDDGRLRFEVKDCGPDWAQLKAQVAGTLSDRKGVNIPNRTLPVSALTEKDHVDLGFALKLGVDWIAQSFVQAPEDVAELRKLVGGRAGVMAKIEKPAAYIRIAEILDHCDGVMVARGDLGVEAPPEDVPIMQKMLVRVAREAGKPVVVATQMLDSMMTRPAPTRAEASDVATAVFDGADAVMLSGETAAGDYPVEATEMMNRGLAADELLAFPDGLMGVAADIEEARAGVILLGSSDRLRAGDEVRRTGRTIDAPVGEALLGRVVDGLGRPLDRGGPIRQSARRPVERAAPAILDRAPVDTPLQTGVTAVDAVVPIGRGQRELIVGDRQTGKTALALSAIMNQRAAGVLCVYCAIGQRASAVARVIAELRAADMLASTVVVVAGGDEAAGLQFIAPYAATAMAEHFMERGRDVLIVYDDLTRHARAYRELSLLLRRPPGREAYPGDIFYVHSRLLERATHLRAERGGGSLTALPIIETQAQDISAYIPTNLISITDGQIYLSPGLFDKAVLPAVDVGRSVSRVGGKAQLPAYRAVAGDLRLSYAQFEELESFARFGTRLDEDSRRQLERGRRVREALKQGERELITVTGQIATLVAVLDGALDAVDPSDVGAAARLLRQAVSERLGDLAERIERGGLLEPADRARIAETTRIALAGVQRGGGRGDA